MDLFERKNTGNESRKTTIFQAKLERKEKRKESNKKKKTDQMELKFHKNHSIHKNREERK